MNGEKVRLRWGMRGRSYIEEQEQQRVAAWLGVWRCASARHLVCIYRPKHHRRGAEKLSLRQAQRVLNVLSRAGQAEVVGLRSDVLRKVYRAKSDAPVLPADWVAVDLASALAEQGAVVLRGRDAAIAVRRHLLDQSPAEVAQVLRQDKRTPRDESFMHSVAVLKSEAILLWVDDGRDIGVQVQELPIWTPGQVGLRIIIRSPDSSVRGSGERPLLGPRMKEMHAALKSAPGAKVIGFWEGGWWHAGRQPQN
jgi:hypothetical protein